jgi:Zn-dependent peptidase ImmA (M78 family)/transcriptional regulator with XRE-family HTH domain
MNDRSSIGERVRRLRVALGLGQLELADHAGLASGAISMLENGRAAVDANAIDSLAAALGCEPWYLTTDQPEPVATKPQLRAYADAPSRFVDRAIADSITAVQFILQMDLPAVPDTLPLFDGDLNDDAEIERFAGVVRAQAALQPDDVVGNAIRAAERLGCVVLPLDSELGRHLGLSMRVDGRPVIRVSRPSDDLDHHVPGDRQRFTVAHELGHLVLHQASRPPVTAIEATRAEKQAHRFAGAFLAPADAVMADLERFGGRVTLGTLAQLKEVWGVSIKSLVVRFQHLNIVSDEQARSLYKQISARRWNKEEPVPVGNEAAVWLSRAISKKLPNAGQPLGDAASGAGISSSYVERWVDWSPSPDVRPGADVVSLDFGRPRAFTHRDAPGRVSRMPVRPDRAR